jgi:hypothetical protein
MNLITITIDADTQVVVPREPTKEMLKAADDLNDQSYIHNYGKAAHPDELYCSMIDAAPLPNMDKPPVPDKTRADKLIRVLQGWIAVKDGDLRRVPVQAAMNEAIEVIREIQVSAHQQTDSSKLRSICAGWKLRAMEFEKCKMSISTMVLRECAEEVEAFLELRQANRTSWFAHEQQGHQQTDQVDERAEFERYAQFNVGQFSAAGMYVRDGKWQYSRPFVQHAWFAWQARASLVHGLSKGEKG